MKLQNYILALLSVMLLGIVLPDGAQAQYHQERGMVRKGNEQFDKRNYRRSLDNYTSALEVDSTNYEAQYNRANAYHHAMFANFADTTTYKARELHSYYDKLVTDTLLSDVQRAEVYRNYGESLFAEENYEAALNSFRESLKLNPDDQETKYNYVLTKRIVDQKREANQQNQNQNQNQNGDGGGGQNDQNQDQNQDQGQNQDGGGQNDQNQQQNSDQNQDNNQGQGDKNDDQNQEDDQQKDGNNDEGDQNDNDKQNGEGNPEEGENNPDDGRPEPKELSPEQQRMLDAIQAEENKTQEKLDEERKGIVVRGKKNW